MYKRDKQTHWIISKTLLELAGVAALSAAVALAAALHYTDGVWILRARVRDGARVWDRELED